MDFQYRSRFRMRVIGRRAGGNCAYTRSFGDDFYDTLNFPHRKIWVLIMSTVCVHWSACFVFCKDAFI